jgi:hypothetical protein
MTKEKIHKILADGELQIGDLIVPCAVLEDGTRVISEVGMGRAFGRKHGGKDWKAKAKIESGGRLPYFLVAKNLKPYINEDLLILGHEPIKYRSKQGGRPAHGIKADLIPNICDVWLKARDAGILTHSQKKVAEKADVLMRGLAHIGIVALIDEVTGYQEHRDRDELQKILKAYISDALLPWTAKFPLDFYKEMFRLRKWQFSPIEYKTKGPRGPRYAGKLTNELIYQKLPKGVLTELRHKNPIAEKGRRRAKHHQFLTDAIGNPHLEKQVAVVTALMRISPDWRVFKRHFARAFPIGPQQKDLFPELEDLPVT